MTTKTIEARRGLLKAGAGAAVLGSVSALSGCATGGSSSASGKKLGRVVVIGGGFGGGTAANYINMWGEGAIEVVLIERQKDFYSCPISNVVLGGVQKMSYITRSYEGLKAKGVVVITDEVIKIDPVKKVVSMRKGADLKYDRLVVSPGTDFKYDTIEGLDAEAQKTVLHAWKAGPQTAALRAQLEAMPNGGVYVLSIPKAPYRCPPGPYERACQIAAYFKREKPKSKVLVLDANQGIVSKGKLFKHAWDTHYKGFIDYQPSKMVTGVDAKNKTVITEFGDKVKGDVLNVVPQMFAGNIARATGLVNVKDAWCGVDYLTWESTAHKGIHVLGDSVQGSPGMPKSGHMANQQAKACAAAIVELMNGRAPIPVTLSNTCYSFTTESKVVHVASVHQWDEAKKEYLPVKGAGGLTKEENELEGAYALGWAQNIWSDVTG
jgi:sulfide dehydrogenase [flavocytochrome c] flavoprotein subunit